MLTKLRLRFTLAILLIASLLLSIVMATIILTTALIIKSDIKRVILSSLDRAMLADFKEKDTFENIKCMIVAERNNTFYTARLEMYTEEEQETIVHTMLSSSERVFFSCLDKSFVYESRSLEDMTIYAIYDATGEIKTINHVWRVIIVSYAVVLAVIAFLAWMLSSAMMKPVSESLQKQKDLVANASHELKTPLTIIDTDITLAKNGLDENHPSLKWLNGIESQTVRMNELIREMLELSRLESTVSTRFETVKISDLLESMTLELEAGCFEKNITMTTEIKNGVEIISDTEKIRKLFSVLLNNAYKYTPDGGKISITLSTKRNYVQVSICNTGAGIPKEKIEHIFERFYKVDESHTGESNSFGLGLAIAKSLVDAISGEIKCESKEGENTCFKLSLPMNSHKQISQQE